MTTYVDASIVLRLVLGQPNAIDDLSAFDNLVSSRLLRVECLRSLDRLGLTAALTRDQVGTALVNLEALLESVTLVEVSSAVLTRAGQPLPSPLGTLDALHLASALLWQDWAQQAVALATHDRVLARAAREYSLRVVGA